MPSEFLLKVRLTHAALAVTFGSSAARAWRTRACASSVRSPASATTGAVPAARRTASAKERRTGVGVCAAAMVAAASASTVRLVAFRDTMEIQVDVSVEVFHDVEAFRHALPEGHAGDGGVHQRRHGELGRDQDVHGPELPARDAALDHAGHEAVTTGHHFFVVELRELRERHAFGHHQLGDAGERGLDRKSTRLNSSHEWISYAV